MVKPKVKICCISSVKEAQLAIEHGADIIGLVSHMPSGPGVIGNDLIQTIVTTIPPHISTCLLTSETDPFKVIQHHRKVSTNAIQLVDALEERRYDLLRKELPDTELIQVIHVIDDRSIEEAKEIAQHVDAILLDSGNPNLSVKELGGTGRTHNWHLSKAIVDSVDIPVFLAGGLNPQNIKDAVHAVRPFGVDLCSGVRTDGKLDEQKLKAFFTAINGYQ